MLPVRGRCSDGINMIPYEAFVLWALFNNVLRLFVSFAKSVARSLPLCTRARSLLSPSARAYARGLQRSPLLYEDIRNPTLNFLWTSFQKELFNPERNERLQPAHCLETWNDDSHTVNHLSDLNNIEDNLTYIRFGPQFQRAALALRTLHLPAPPLRRTIHSALPLRLRCSA